MFAQDEPAKASWYTSADSLQTTTCIKLLGVKKSVCVKSVAECGLAGQVAPELYL